MPPGAERYWRAWHALRFDRQYGAMGGESPIMFLSIDAYARRYRIRGAAFETFHALVGAMDEEYLEHVQRKADDARQADEERRRVAGRGPVPNPDEVFS
ncbi:hypothetical protein AC629_22850 [Bradyrhizobium sp. NAS80.1]|uniref:phage tail assembly chaperone n=1 Tax=Bradyrhizobium sp. NAS80.1 TaxID=1680159 RepID=UPI00095CB7AF|nr:hypothetical protein [Bradyrhizobium sp. NAS80.1]OKO83382.1 hypothetical protein AC629_22850 [Bradyrhizobium sp. NAS80.1]